MNKTGKGMADYARTKLGTPYFYGSKMDVLTENFANYMHKAYPGTVTTSYIDKARRKGLFGKVCVDCSGLIGSYRGKQIGSSQLYQTASKRMSMADLDSFPQGTVLWRSGHVGIYIGKNSKGEHECIEAKGIDYGVVLSKVNASSWKYGLLFSDMAYIMNEVPSGSTKERNPYPEPTTNIKKGSKGEGVRWVQFELQEAGYAKPFVYKSVSYKGIVVDGLAGAVTDAAIRHYQESAKLAPIDGIVGKVTRASLKAN